MENKKKILIISATHGDERIGFEVIKALKKKGYQAAFDCLIANPKALKTKRRFIDCDLNRSYPGDKNSSLYEKRLAYKNLKIARKYRYIIDLHEASSGKDNFIIAPREKLPKLFPLQFIDLKRVLLWPDPRGPLSQFLENAIELEFGMKNKQRNKVVTQAIKIVENFIKNITAKYRLVSDCQREVYYVYGKLLIENNKNIKINRLVDFRLIKIGGEQFYPLLTGQYLNQGIICYKMKRLSKAKTP